MHLKRQGIPKQWPIKRKGTAYVVRPNSSMDKGIPILIALRDVFEIVQNRKEAKKIIHEKKVKLNGKFVKDEKNLIQIYDVVEFVPSREYFRAKIKANRKYWFEKIDEKESNIKISKIINKKTLRKKKNQINLFDGRNILSDEKCKTGDSVVFDLKSKKISKILPLKEKASILVLAGKHAGETGVIEKINEEKQMVEVKASEDFFNALIKQIMVIE